MNRGQFDRLVTFQSGAATTNDYGEEILTWADVQRGKARVKFGTAQEKRQAAQEGAEQTATFEFMPTNALRAVTSKDRIFLHEDESYWDVQGPGERLERNLIRFTATRAV